MKQTGRLSQEVRVRNFCIAVYISFKSYELFHFIKQLWSLGNKIKIKDFSQNF